MTSELPTSLADLAEILSSEEPPTAALKSLIKKVGQDLAERFRHGESVVDLVHRRARVIDEILLACWRHQGLATAPALSLVAVGGYGRGELHPGSDVDIMVLLGADPNDHERGLIGNYLMFLWDIGLEVGHSVRTVDDCSRESEADISVTTNLMEARLLCGDQAVFDEMKRRTEHDRIWPSREFFTAKMAEQVARHQRYHDTAYNLEPNVKVGPGGLRDIQMIGWVVKRHYAAKTLRDLVELEFLTEREFEQLRDGQEFLWKVRFALHTLANRREDRLLFDHQRAIAERFGYTDHKHNLAVEQFMKRYYRTIMSLQRLNEMLLEFFQEVILLSEQPRSVVKIGRRFQSVNGFLEVASSTTFRRYPFALLEIFLILQQHPECKGVRASTIRLIRDNLHRIDDTFRADIRCRSLFLEILRQPHGITHALRRMHQYGVLATYLPSFGKIVGLMQYDLYHVYTVDQHTLFVVRNIRTFMVEEKRHEFPFCSSILTRLPKPELLIIAGMFHDIAKGRGGNHAELGAVDARDFCLSHGLGNYDSKLVAWLVRSHLDMSRTAQREDISDPEVINQFAARIGDKARLDYLYLLTVADIYGTNPGLWNSWRDSLLQELYSTTAKALRRGLDNPVDGDELVQETVAQTRELLSMEKSISMDAASFWSTVGEDYFLRYSADEIAWHTREIVRAREEDLPMVLVRNGRGGLELFLYAHDRANFFASTTAALDHLNLTIMDARIITADNGMTLDSYVVLEADGGEIRNPRRLAEIRHSLRRDVRDTAHLPKSRHRRMNRQLKHFRTPTRVNFLPEDGRDRTRMEVTARDRPGLLFTIGCAFIDADVAVQNAKILTVGERAEDVFYLTERDGSPLRENTRRSLSDFIIAALGAQELA